MAGYSDALAQKLGIKAGQKVVTIKARRVTEAARPVPEAVSFIHK